MRLPVLFWFGGGLFAVCLPDPAGAQETAQPPDMRQLVLALVKQRTAAIPTPSAAAAPDHDPEVVKLPPLLVSAPVLRVPSAEDTVRAVVGFVRPVSYGEYTGQDQKQQDHLHDMLDLADLARISGDTEVGQRLRREAYRAFVRDPTPLERAMDRSANGGRY